MRTGTVSLPLHGDSIYVLQESLDNARLDKKEKYDAIKRLGSSLLYRIVRVQL